MFKKSFVCLMLMFILFASSCSTISVKEKATAVPVKKEVSFFPQNNVVEYIIDSSVKQFPKEKFKDRKVAFIGIKTNCQNKETIQEFVNYFVASFEKNVQKLVTAEEADVAMQVVLKLNYDFKLPKAPRVRQSKLFVGLTPLNPKDFYQESPVELKYDYYNKKETMAIEFSLIAVDLKTKEIMHFNTATCVSILDSSGFNKKTTLNY